MASAFVKVAVVVAVAIGDSKVLLGQVSQVQGLLEVLSGGGEVVVVDGDAVGFVLAFHGQDVLGFPH